MTKSSSEAKNATNAMQYHRSASAVDAALPGHYPAVPSFEPVYSPAQLCTGSHSQPIHATVSPLHCCPTFPHVTPQSRYKVEVVHSIVVSVLSSVNSTYLHAILQGNMSTDALLMRLGPIFDSLTDSRGIYADS